MAVIILCWHLDYGFGALFWVYVAVKKSHRFTKSPSSMFSPAVSEWVSEWVSERHEREWETWERVRDRVSEWVCVCVCVCEREWETEWERERQREREREWVLVCVLEGFGHVSATLLCNIRHAWGPHEQVSQRCSWTEEMSVAQTICSGKGFAGLHWCCLLIIDPRKITGNRCVCILWHLFMLACRHRIYGMGWGIGGQGGCFIRISV